jgi:hypothetical protein
VELDDQGLVEHTEDVIEGQDDTDEDTGQEVDDEGNNTGDHAIINSTRSTLPSRTTAATFMRASTATDQSPRVTVRKPMWLVLVSII